jgi:hypothetical protein
MPDLRHLITRPLTRAARESGQTMSEYAIALVVISLTSLTLFTGLSGGVANAASNVVRLLP